MQGDKQVIAYLNQALKAELTAINQYFLHARMLESWGLERFNEQEYKGSIEEMKHADRLIRRILFLEGLPNLQDYGKLLVAESVHEILVNDRKLEAEAIELYREIIACCESVQDYASRELVDALLADEEEHLDWLDTQLALYDSIGREKFLQAWM
ncbi:MAG: bacterioferritin [Halofilum sp. (in: g-proteobacteria)]|nr:bacterioferritin [Halofilum sp. (in: g-proteobacteria)]